MSNISLNSNENNALKAVINPTHSVTVKSVSTTNAVALGLENVTNESKDVMFQSPTFTGVPLAPTAGAGTNTTQIATTEFVQTAVEGKDTLTELTDVTIDGTPADNEILAYDTSSAKFINQTLSEAGINATAISLGNVTNESKATMFTSAALTGVPTAPTPDSPDNSTKIATTAYVQHKFGGMNSPAVTNLQDTTITAIRDGEILVYDSPTGKYINQTLTEAGITASGLSLGSVVNQSPRANAISLLTQQALDLKSNSSSPTFLGGQFNSTVVFNSPVGFKGDITFNSPITLNIPDNSIQPSAVIGIDCPSVVGLGKVTNESPRGYPISLDVQTALDTKVTNNSPTFLGATFNSQVTFNSPTSFGGSVTFSSSSPSSITFSDTPNIGNGGNFFDTNKDLATRGFVVDQVSSLSTTSATLTGTTTVRGPFNVTTNDTPTFRGAIFNSPVIFNGAVSGIVASEVGLGNVTNESKATMFTNAALSSSPTAPTPNSPDNSTRIATTAYVTNKVTTELDNILGNAPGTLNTIQELADALSDSPGQIADLLVKTQANTVSINTNATNIALKIGANSPVFTSQASFEESIFNCPSIFNSNVHFNSSSPSSVVFNDTPSIGNVGNIDNNKHLATRGFVTDQVSTKANTAGPTLTGTTTIRGSFNITGNDTPTFRSATFNSPVVFNGPVTGIVSSEVGLGNVTNESKATMFTSAALTGTPTAPTASASTNTTQVATTAFVKGEIDLANTLVSLSDTAINSPALGSALRHGHTIVYDSPSGKFVSDSPGELHLNTFNSPKHLANTVGAINAIRSDVNLKSNSNSPTFLGATFNSKVTFNSPVELGGKVRFSSSSPASITVSGAGTTSVNGTYPLYTGSLSHLNPKGNTLVYNKGGFYLYQLNSNSQWRIDTDASEDNGYYTNTATTDNPPISGWTSANEGDDPAPTLFSPSSVSFSDTPSVGAEGNLDTNKHIATRGFVIDQVATENTVAEMNDVTITNLRSGQVLVYDSPTSKFVNDSPGVLDIDAFDSPNHLPDIKTTLTNLQSSINTNTSSVSSLNSTVGTNSTNIALKANSNSPTFLGATFNSKVNFNSPVQFKGAVTFDTGVLGTVRIDSPSILKSYNIQNLLLDSPDMLMQSGGLNDFYFDKTDRHNDSPAGKQMNSNMFIVDSPRVFGPNVRNLHDLTVNANVGNILEAATSKKGTPRNNILWLGQGTELSRLSHFNSGYGYRCSMKNNVIIGSNLGTFGATTPYGMANNVSIGHIKTGLTGLSSTFVGTIDIGVNKPHANGAYSISIGNLNRSTTGSTSVGSHAYSHYYSTAVGRGARASYRGISICTGTFTGDTQISLSQAKSAGAAANAYAVAIGIGGTYALTNGDVAIGKSTKLKAGTGAYGSKNVGIGYKNKILCSKYYSQLIEGSATIATGQAGFNTNTRTGYNVAIGREVYVQSAGDKTVLAANVAIGNRAKIDHGSNNIAIGHRATAQPTGFLNDSPVINNVLLGVNARGTGNHGIAIGDSPHVTADYGIALGYHTHVNSDYSVAIGHQVHTTESKTVEVGYWSSATARGGAVRIDGTAGAVSMSYKHSGSAFTDGGATAGAEDTGELGRGMYTLRYDSPNLKADINFTGTGILPAGTIKSITLGTI